MAFVNLVFLYGLFAVLIPIIIHLFNFRRYKTVYFPNLQLLRNIQVQSKRKSRIRNLILLLLRIMAVISLVLAFAQPYIPSEQGSINFEKSSAVCIYVDNSFSMNAGNTSEKHFDEAKVKAREIINTFRPSDKFQLLTNDLKSKHQRLVSKEKILNFIDDLEITPVVTDLSEIVARFNDQLRDTEMENKIIFLISDFQKSITNLEEISADSLVMINFIPLNSSEGQNISIDSVWFDSPVLLNNMEAILMAKVSNYGSKDFEKVPLKVTINEIQKSVASINIKNNETIIREIPLTINNKGLQTGIVSISDYPVTFDDQYFFSFSVPEKISVLMINEREENTYLNALYGDDPLFNLENVTVNSLDYSRFSDFSCVILNALSSISSGLIQDLVTQVAEGTSLVIIPSKDLNPEKYNKLFNEFGAGRILEKAETELRIEKVNTDHLIFKDVFKKVSPDMDLPLINNYFTQTSGNMLNKEVLLSFVGGDPALSVFSFKEGSVYVLNVPLDAESGNLPNHPLFVPVFYNMARYSVKTEFLQHMIGQRNQINVNKAIDNKKEVLKIIDKKNSFEFIPQQRSAGNNIELFFNDQFNKAGNYYLMHSLDTISTISVNYNRIESALDYYTTESLNQQINQLSNTNIHLMDFADKPVKILMDEINKGSQLWKLFVIFALIFLAFEIIVIRVFERK